MAGVQTASSLAWQTVGTRIASAGAGTVLASTAAVVPAAYEHDAGLGRSTTSDSGLGFVDRDSAIFSHHRPTLNGGF